MNIAQINSKTDLEAILPEKSKAYLLVYKSGLEQSDCAIHNLSKMKLSDEEPLVMAVDVNKTKDIHTSYGITSAPSLLEFESGQLKNIIKGCQNPEVLKSMFAEAVYTSRMKKEGKEIKHVTVYSTPICSWCTTLKNYLRQNKIRFTDVDISRDPGAAKELVNRTGQQGVPQTEINGHWVVGFDQSKLDNLLEIKKQ